MNKPKFYITTTAARTLSFFMGQPRLWMEKFEVCAIAGEKEKLVAFAEGEGINYKYMPMHREISLASDVVCLFRFIWLFIKDRPYIVHGNTPKASMLSMVAAWLTIRPVRIYMCHGLRYETTAGKFRKVLMAMEWLSCHCATQVICVSRGVMGKLVEDGLCPKRKGTVVGYGTAGGIDTNYFSRKAIQDVPDVREDLGIPHDAFVFSFVGRIVGDKGINELVEAFNILSREKKSLYLFLVGYQENDTDPIKPITQNTIDSNSNIISFGRKEDVRPYLRASNAFVLPSYREGLGQVLLEANAMDVPCIASDIIGPRDVIEPNKNGELVEVRNAKALYNKMKEWVESPEKVKTMSLSCRQFVIERYTTESVRYAYYNYYCQLADKE